MRQEKREKLEAAGWRLGSTEEFLGLSRQEADYVLVKLALSRALRERRLQTQLSQTALAELVQSSQSRIAKMEAGDPGVSIDLLMKSLLALGATPGDLARAIASVPERS
jgi:DNA-binding XRE family transcriptional regulator